jgi:hypothetical protein
MRFRVAAMGAVLVAGSLTGAGLAAMGPAAATVVPSVTIKAIDREGKAVQVTASLDSAGSSTGGVHDTLTSGHATAVPPGTYNVAAWVQEPSGDAQTLVDRELTVTKSTTVTFDARGGHRLSFTVNDKSVVLNGLEAEPYSPGTNTWSFGGFNDSPAGGTYLTAGKLPSGWKIFLEGDLIRPAAVGGGALSPVEYDLIHVLQGSVPSNLTFFSATSGLAADHVTVRQLDPGVPGLVSFQPQLGNGSPLPSSMWGQSGATPYSVDFHFTPGYSWAPCVSYGSAVCEIQQLNTLPVFGVHRYSQTFGSAAFSPSTVAVDVLGTRLDVENGQWLLNDPNFTGGGGLTVASHSMALYQGGKLLKQSTGDLMHVTIPYATNWYRLDITASRGPGATLAKSLSASLTFPAAAQHNGLGEGVNSLWPQVLPTLNWLNAAQHGSKTAVRVQFGQVYGLSPTGVSVWASVNGGKNWYRQRVTHSGSSWLVTVTNPAKAGYVSLRVLTSESNGGTTEETLINAYRVS